MFTRNYRTLLATTNRLNLGTRSLAVLFAGVNTGLSTLRFRLYSSVSHAVISKRFEVMQRIDSPGIGITAGDQAAWQASGSPWARRSGSDRPACRAFGASKQRAALGHSGHELRYAFEA